MSACQATAFSTGVSGPVQQPGILIGVLEATLRDSSTNPRPRSWQEPSPPRPVPALISRRATIPEEMAILSQPGTRGAMTEAVTWGGRKADEGQGRVVPWDRVAGGRRGGGADEFPGRWRLAGGWR